MQLIECYHCKQLFSPGDLCRVGELDKDGNPKQFRVCTICPNCNRFVDLLWVDLPKKC